MRHIVLLLPLMERMLIIWFAAYLFSQTSLFWNIVKSRSTVMDKLGFVVFFSGIAILGTYLGINLDDGAIANIRPLGAIVAGLIGGPGLGAAVGAIAGIHRFSLGGITGLACGLATVAEGLVGGLVGKYYKQDFLNVKSAIVAGVLGELTQIAFVLALTKPIEKAIAIEQVVGIPMIVVNTIGVIGFVAVIRDVFQKYNGMIIAQFNRFVELEQTIAQYMNQSIQEDNAQLIIQEIAKRTDLKGLIMADDDRLLSATVPIAEAELVRDKLVKEKLAEGYKLKVSNNRSSAYYYCVSIGENFLDQKLWIGIKLLNKPFYDPFIYNFARSLAILIENQRAQNAVRQYEEEMAKAQLKALKAQIQPHFLFNSLSTIASLCRTDALKARDLIIDLAQFFRKTIEEESNFSTLENELEAIEAYLRIEKARLGERLQISYAIDEAALENEVPCFCIQPLVENAIKHGISKRIEPGLVHLKCTLEGNLLSIEVQNSKPTETACKGCGHAVNNIKERLFHIYGGAAGLQLDLDHEAMVVAKLLIPSRRQPNGL